MNELKAAISVNRLTKKFGAFIAVNEINFEVDAGEIFGFLGPNGSGKTTTIRMMLGLLKPTTGTVKVLGISTTDEYKAIRHHFGYMSQRFGLYNDLTVLQNLNFYGAVYGLPQNLIKERIHNVLEMSNMTGHENQKTKNLSGGWRQRLALSAAILHKPKVLFLDEPTAGVDPISRRKFWDLLYDLVAQKITVFITTHYMDEAEHCHRLAFIQRGEIIASGSPSEIKQKKIRNKILELTPRYTDELIKLLNQLKASDRNIFDEFEFFGSQIHVISNNPKILMQILKNKITLDDASPVKMEIIDPSLEDVFIASMRRDQIKRT